MTRILVTGGAGYIGSVLTPALLAAGHEVTVLDAFLHRENSLASVYHDPHLEVVSGDTRSPAVIRPLVDKADIIIPLAAIVGAPACDRDVNAAYSTNRQAIEYICNIASPSQWIIIPNSNSGYGTTGDAECTEDTPLRPISVYGLTKMAAEQRVMMRENSIALRLATVFGASPRMRLDLMVNEFVWRASHDRALILFEANARRNFVHVRDVANAFLHCIRNFEAMKSRVYNCGDTRANMTKLDLCCKIKGHVPDFVFMEAPIGQDPDKRNYIVSNARLEATGWQPTYSLDDGVTELLKLYRTLRPNRYGNV